MGTREIILIAAIPVLLFCIYSSLKTINQLYRAGRLSADNRFTLSYFSLLLPLPSFLLIQYFNWKYRK